jgi:hypothetical protein
MAVLEVRAVQDKMHQRPPVAVVVVVAMVVRVAMAGALSSSPMSGEMALKFCMPRPLAVKAVKEDKAAVEATVWGRLHSHQNRASMVLMEACPCTAEEPEEEANPV